VRALIEYHPVIKKILKKVAKESEQEQENRKSPLGFYRASSIGKCGRQYQYAALGNKAEPLTPETGMIFHDGHMHHNEIRRLLGKVGTLSNVEQSIQKKYKHKGESFVVTGTCDGVWNGKVFDVKSMSTFRFKALDKIFPDDLMDYVFQLTLYMDMLKFKEGMFIFKDKNSGELRVIELDFDKEVLVDALDWIVEVHKGIKTKTLMDRPYLNNSFQCKTCPFRLHCYKMPMEGKHWF
jgi:hypothetical protein